MSKFVQVIQKLHISKKVQIIMYKSKYTKLSLCYKFLPAKINFKMYKSRFYQCTSTCTNLVQQCYCTVVFDPVALLQTKKCHSFKNFLANILSFHSSGLFFPPVRKKIRDPERACISPEALVNKNDA